MSRARARRRDNENDFLARMGVSACLAELERFLAAFRRTLSRAPRTLRHARQHEPRA